MIRHVVVFFKVRIVKWEAAAGWRWDAKEEDICGMCRSAFEVRVFASRASSLIGNVAWLHRLPHDKFLLPQM